MASQQFGIIGKIFIAFVLGTVGLISIVTFTGDTATNYELENPDNLTSYDIAISMAERQEEIKNSMDEEVISETDNPLLQWQGAMNSLRLLFSTSDDMQNFTSSAIQDIHLPVQFNLIILIIVMIFIIAIMSILLKWVI